MPGRWDYKAQPGQLLTRIRERNNPDATGHVVYSGKHFLADSFQLIRMMQSKIKLSRTDESVMLVEPGMVLISLTTNKAVIVSQAHEGHLLTSNYIWVDYDNSKIDPYYFCYVYKIRGSPEANCDEWTGVEPCIPSKPNNCASSNCSVPLWRKRRRVGAIYLLQQKRIITIRKIKLEKVGSACLTK